MLTALAFQSFNEVFNPQLSNAGTGAELTATLASTGNVRSATVHTAGSGYSVGDVLSVSSSTPATFTVLTVGASGEVATIAVTTAGAGFSAAGSNVATTVSPSGGTGCKLDYVVEKAIASVTVVDGGADYVKPFISVVGAVGDTTAVLAPTVTDTAIASVTVTSGGKYVTAPTLTVDPRGANSDATFLALLRSVDEDDTLQNERLLAVISEIEASVGFPEWAADYVTAAKTTLSA